MTRPRFSQKERKRHFLRREGYCWLCCKKINFTKDTWHIEHANAWWMSRDNSDENLYLVHEECHKAKTAEDAKARAKVKRIINKSAGVVTRLKKKIPSRGFQ